MRFAKLIFWTLLMTNIATSAVGGLQKTDLYVLLKNSKGQVVAPMNTPSVVLSGVSKSRCLLECVFNDDCLSSNYCEKTERCDLFFYNPTELFRIVDGCPNYRRKDLVNLTTCDAQVSRPNSAVLAPCCSLPFTYQRNLSYSCVTNISNPSDIGCYLAGRNWVTCAQNIDFKADYVNASFIFPNISQPIAATFLHGWLIVQKNVLDGSTVFNRSWVDYRNGFGDPARNYYWFGNEKLYLMLSSGSWKLRVEVQSTDTGSWYSAEYSYFRLSNETTFYVLSVSGYTGDAGDGFTYAEQMPGHVSNGMKFSTIDKDNDLAGWGSCARFGGWWYRDCGTSCLTCFANGMNIWGTLRMNGLASTYFISSSRMMIKRN